MISFEFEKEQYKVVWPVLPSRTKDDRAAKIQAATMLYHDIKAKCLSASVLGTRTSFFAFLLLPDGQIASDVSTGELNSVLPGVFQHKRLESGEDVVDGEFSYGN